jgi:hypothetical protein
MKSSKIGIFSSFMLSTALLSSCSPFRTVEIIKPVTETVCDFEGLSHTYTDISPNTKYYFIGNQAVIEPTEIQLQNAWLTVESDFSTSMVKYFDIKSNSWKEYELMSLFGTGSELTISSENGLEAFIKMDQYGFITVHIIGGICVDKVSI